ncbi:hypothetical protein NHX12_014727 [Muraenolepis orangiensis]|uniref:Uncharacterized protein n=1 Tax=Muraenolepis orangiensis TaxID=630683 RepID=A0A9Q0I5D8_9TELE|nr:hypothetical protein NHX12_014727 [Muraenolepis orangiensis]
MRWATPLPLPPPTVVYRSAVVVGLSDAGSVVMAAHHRGPPSSSASSAAAAAAAAASTVSSSPSKWLFSREQLDGSTPSRRCGVEADRELSYRQQAANLIQDMGQRLNVYPPPAAPLPAPTRLAPRLAC